MRIITVSRQFGSGGRELGERLAEVLGWDYYDKQIIETLVEKHDLDEKYVREVLSRHGWHQVQLNYQLTYRNSFSHLLGHQGMNAMTRLLQRQSEIIKEIAQAGNDSVIVGRDADVILHDYHPFRILVCADLESRLERCLQHEERHAPEERLSEKEIRKNIRIIDKKRVHTREILTGKRRDDSSSFDLVVNASGRDLSKLACALKEFSLHWFEDGKNEEQQDTGITD